MTKNIKNLNGKMLSNLPPKGTADRFPEEFRKRKYIFDTWRKVCLKFGFEEYLGPLVENSEIWRAKSGEDVGGSELTFITDREGNISENALRPEMTPSVTRMVTRVWKEKEKPIKWFSIANFYRNEKPQKGRNREFRQLNCDIFGDETFLSDVETLTLALEIMASFEAPKGSYKLKLNHRELINSFLKDILSLDENSAKILTRALDKYSKLGVEKFRNYISDLNLSLENLEKIDIFMNSKNLKTLEENFGNEEFLKSIKTFASVYENLEKLGYGEFIEFSADLIRGFDYYDGIIFEMFDTNPENSRSLFGGGRYNGLANIFGVKENIPAVGFAPGDETLKIFLENWGCFEKLNSSFEEKYFMPILDEKLIPEYLNLSKILRNSNLSVNMGFKEKKLAKAIKFASENDYTGIIIFGEEEFKNSNYKIKNLLSGEEKTFNF